MVGATLKLLSVKIRKEWGLRQWKKVERGLYKNHAHPSSNDPRRARFWKLIPAKFPTTSQLCSDTRSTRHPPNFLLRPIIIWCKEVQSKGERYEKGMLDESKHAGHFHCSTKRFFRSHFCVCPLLRGYASTGIFSSANFASLFRNFLPVGDETSPLSSL